MKQMAEEKRLRFPVWAFVLSGVLVGIPLSVFGLYLYIKAVEERRWADMRSYCEQVAREVLARDSKRAVLRGEAVPGNAWEDYEPAIQSIQYKNVSVASEYLSRHPKADRANAQTAVEQCATSLRALHRGASRAESRRRADWQSPGNGSSPSPNFLAIMAACRARLLAEDGHTRDAVQVLLDAAQFGVDAGWNGDLMDGYMSTGILHTTQEEMKWLLSGRTLGREECLELVRALEHLDQSFPREADAYAVEPMSTGCNYLRQGSLRAIMDATGMSDPISPTWRYGFSERLVIVDAFEQNRAWSRGSQEAAGKPWKEARQEYFDQLDLRTALRNPLLEKFYKIQQTLASSPPSPPRNPFRERLAQLRMLRAAATFRFSGEAPVFDDPYGDKIRSSMTEKHLKLWSVGGDGVDDGGSGEWDAGKGKDIVLEVER